MCTNVEQQDSSSSGPDAHIPAAEHDALTDTEQCTPPASNLSSEPFVTPEQIEVLLEDRLSCVAPVLREALKSSLGLPADCVKHTDVLRRNVAAHPRSAGNKLISSLDVAELKGAQRGARQKQGNALAAVQSAKHPPGLALPITTSDVSCQTDDGPYGHDSLPSIDVRLTHAFGGIQADMQQISIKLDLLALAIGPRGGGCYGGAVPDQRNHTGPDSGSGFENSSAYVIGSGRGGRTRHVSREVGPVSAIQQYDMATGNADSDAETDDSGSGIENPSAYVIGAGRGRRGLTKPVAFGTYRHSAIFRSHSGS